tara:strand:+ start:318 stop:965 length:648 start_codon:yes stop_codon:yes gene_type:complete
MNWLSIKNLNYTSYDKLFHLFIPELVIKKSKNLIHGSNGIGKTTFFKLLLNKLKFQSGNLHLDKSLKTIIHVDQQLSLVDYLSIKENCMLHAKLQKKKFNKIEFDINFNEISNQFNLLPEANKPIYKLSYGQKQRACILKALLIKPNLILADEPTSFQDYKMKEIVTNTLLNYTKKNDAKLLMISHDKEIVSEFDTTISFDSIINGAKNHVFTNN